MRPAHVEKPLVEGSTGADENIPRGGLAGQKRNQQCGHSKLRGKAVRTLS